MDKNEFNRLERANKKAEKKKSNEPLKEWAIQLEKQLVQKTKEYYDKLYNIRIEKSIKWYIVAIIYTLHFNEKTHFGARRLQDIMNDLQVTVELFSTKEYSAEDYINQLQSDGIVLQEYLESKNEK